MNKGPASNGTGARETLVEWASSPGFAAIHNGQATNEQIVEDLLKWLDLHDFEIVRKKWRK